MRKGFTLTLTALATVFLATSALALGPTVTNVPDVFIGPQAAAGAPAEVGVNMFRYTDAFVLWDYVHRGVTSGAGSTSDTLFWTWAAKNADYATKQGVDPFLNPATAATDPAGIHYSIAQQNGAVVTPIQPTGADIVAWTPQINSAPGLASHTLDLSTLTFRNIRLSPPPDLASYPAPTAMPNTLPAGVLDFQEASLFVTDGVTSPQGYDKILLVTVDAGPDFLSGGPVWEPVADVASTTPAFPSAPSLKLYCPMDSQNVNADLAPAAVTGTNSGTSVNITTPAVNPNWPANTAKLTFYSGMWFQNVSTILGAAGTTPLAPGYLYRVQATLSSTNAAATANPTIQTGLQGRAAPPASGGSGFGEALLNAGATFGPQVGRTFVSNGYLSPIAQSDSLLWFQIFDPNNSGASGGGTITWSNIKISRVLISSLVPVATKVNMSTFSANVAGGFTSFGVGYTSYTDPQPTPPTFSHTPVSGSAATMSQTCVSSTSTGNGFQSMDFGSLFTPTNAGDIVVLKAALTGAGSGRLPDVWLNIQPNDSSYQGTLLFGFYAAGGPSATSKDYFTALDVPAALAAVQWGFNFRTTVEYNNVNGTITCSNVTITEYAPPAE